MIEVKNLGNFPSTISSLKEQILLNVDISAVKGVITITDARAKSIMYILDNKTYIEPFTATKTLTGTIKLIRLFNGDFTEKQKRDFIQLYSILPMPSEFRKIDILDYRTTTGFSSTKWNQNLRFRYSIDTVSEIDFPGNQGFYALRLNYNDGTFGEVVSYRKFTSSDIGVTKECTIVQEKPITSISYSMYDISHNWKGTGFTITAEVKEFGVLKDFHNSTLNKTAWTCKETNEVINVSNLVKIEKKSIFDCRRDMYLYGNDKECSVGVVKYSRIAYNGNNLDWQNTNAVKATGHLTPIKEILLDTKIYLGCWHDIHYAKSSNNQYVYKSIDGEDWVILWETGFIGNIWHLVVTPNNRVVVALHTGTTGNNGLFVSDVNGANFVKKLDWTATYGSTVSTYQDIQIHNNIILLNEYDSGAYGARTGAKVWMSKDYGETFKVVFDAHKHPIAVNGGEVNSEHVHGAFYDPFWDRVWVCCGDRFMSGIFWSDTYWDRPVVDDDFSDYKQAQYDPYSDSVDRAKGVPQPIAGYALKDAVIFGTDGAPNGIFATFRNSKDSPTFERVVQIGEDDIAGAITVIPSRYHQVRQDRPLYIQAAASNLTYNRIYGTFNGIDWFVAWEDNCPRSNADVDTGVETRRAYCWEGGEYTWVCTRGWNDAGVNKLLKCKSIM